MKIKTPEMFAIGSRLWPGLSKLVEEAGEVVQVMGQISGDTADLTLYDRFVEELGDVLAACEFVIQANGLNWSGKDSRTDISDENATVEVSKDLGVLIQVVGKLIETGGETTHWDGSDLHARLTDAIWRLKNSSSITCRVYGFSESVDARRYAKIQVFCGWHIERLNSG